MTLTDNEKNGNLTVKVDKAIATIADCIIEMNNHGKLSYIPPMASALAELVSTRVYSKAMQM